jgi:spermidine/putrescine transport system ATP-binding protein
MRSIQFKDVTKRFGSEKVLQNFSLTVPGGKFFALLGPSGCGKTTILRLIAGLEQADQGAIFLGDDNITNVAPNRRSVNTVFQNYALFAHMTVFNNVAYALSVRGIDKDVIEQKVMRMLRTVRLSAHLNKYPDQLSGGQRQRVALARAMINEPDVLLFDEPLAALDVQLRERMLVELIEIQDKLKTTFIYVTHDQSEALTVADQMAIMNYKGEIEQIGTPEEIYEFPRTSFVAQFVGTSNFISGNLVSCDADSVVVDVPSLGHFQANSTKKCKTLKSDSTVLMSVRPEKICISKSSLVGFSNHMEGVVESIVYNGRSTIYHVRLANEMVIQVFEQNEEHFPEEVVDYDDHVHLYWQKNNVVLLER